MRFRVNLLVCLFAGLAIAQTKDLSPRDLARVSFANLGSPPDGRIAYCVDCVASNPTTGGGPGAVVRREAGVWNGGGGSTSSLLFSGLTSGINTTATMTVGAGSTFTYVSTGIINANRLLGTSLSTLLGNGGKLIQATGTFTSGNILATDLSGNIVDAGVATANIVAASGSLTSGLPVIGAGGASLSIGSRQGNTTKYITYAGSAPATNDCPKFDASGNLTTSGAGCGTVPVFQNTGTPFATESVLNVVPGNGVNLTTSNPSGKAQIQFSLDTAVAMTLVEIPAVFGEPSGSALTAGATTTRYFTVPYACTIAAWNILVDAGTVTVKVWRKATGTAIPTSSDSINTSGLSLSSGTAIHSTTLTDFTSTVISANDIIGINLSAVATAKFVSFMLQCNR